MGPLTRIKKMNRKKGKKKREKKTSKEETEDLHGIHGEKKRETLTSKMKMFLGGMQDGQPRKMSRSASFWGLGSQNSAIDRKRLASGRLVDIKTLEKGANISLTAEDEEGSHDSNGDVNLSHLSQHSHGQMPLFIRPWVFNPTHIRRQLWDILFVISSLLYTAVRVPYAIAFDIDEFAEVDAWFVLNRIVDFVFISDMVMVLLTAYKDGRKMVTSHRRIAIRYLKSWFWFDLIASVPLDLLIWMSTGAQMGDSESDEGDLSRSTKLIRVIKIFRTIRILRLLKLKRVVMTIEVFFGLSFNVMGIGKFVISIVCCLFPSLCHSKSVFTGAQFLLAHLLACGFLGVSGNGGWIDAQDEASRGRKYVASIYWAMTTMSTIGYGVCHLLSFDLRVHPNLSCMLVFLQDIHAVTLEERMYSILAAMLGATTFTYGVTRIVHIMYVACPSRLTCICIL